jgi:blue copper oxidase
LPDRRDFLKLMGAGAGLVVTGGLATLSACDRSPTEPRADGADDRLLRSPASVSAANLSLLAAPGVVAIGGGQSASGWLFNGSLPGPTVRARRGEQARITLINQLPEETIVHWHGMLVPEEADGHPRYAIPPGSSYEYDFPLQQRAAINWYHPHAHHRTAGQVHRGLAGFFIVSDEEEDALQLPDGSREILLMLQDRRTEGGAGLDYLPSAEDMVTGFLGDTPFCNGVQTARLLVNRRTYRFRILNASNARVYRLALSTGAPVTVIGNDGGLLGESAAVDSVYLGVGERVDLLVDLSAHTPGEHLMLKSLPFPTFGGPGGVSPQGMEMNLLDIEVRPGGSGEDPALPPVLSNVPLLSPGAATRVRTFEFKSTGGAAHAHLINDKSFDMHRIDEQIGLGDVERWIFVNSSALPHPVHVHGTHFQVLSRSGGRGTVYPYEGGLKDTVLLMPTETVEVLVSFEAYRGIFPLHCHNLEHEDMGMMLNVEVL